MKVNRPFCCQNEVYMTQQKLLEMELHETVEVKGEFSQGKITTDWRITRVIGGWLYQCCRTTTTTFVPEPKKDLVLP
jgi:chaperonin cofactor prefoldin